MEYQLLEWRDQDLVRLDIKINGEDAPPLSTVCHRDQAYARGKGEEDRPLKHDEDICSCYLSAMRRGGAASRRDNVIFFYDVT